MRYMKNDMDKDWRYGEDMETSEASGARKIEGINGEGNGRKHEEAMDMDEYHTQPTITHTTHVEDEDEDVGEDFDWEDRMLR